MKTPSYTDLDRHKSPYVKAEDTDIRRTFQRIREQIREQVLEEEPDTEHDFERFMAEDEFNNDIFEGR